jgi:hypothetical protein
MQKKALSRHEDYFQWLISLIDYRRHRPYLETLRYLHSVAFYSLVPNDDNRGADGVRLRGVYEEETNNLFTREDLEEPCTMLEMLVALADRYAFQVFDPGETVDIDIPSSFWQLIRNLNLKPFGLKKNAKIIEDLLERNYTPSGDGGLFPLGSPRNDQRHVEIWYQMHAYLEEKML